MMVLHKFHLCQLLVLMCALNEQDVTLVFNDLNVLPVTQVVNKVHSACATNVSLDLSTCYFFISR